MAVTENNSRNITKPGDARRLTLLRDTIYWNKRSLELDCIGTTDSICHFLFSFHDVKLSSRHTHIPGSRASITRNCELKKKNIESCLQLSVTPFASKSRQYFLSPLSSLLLLFPVPMCTQNAGRQSLYRSLMWQRINKAKIWRQYIHSLTQPRTRFNTQRNTRTNP